jgi:diguanylate cyclase (GGDEF)-like protein
MKISGAQNEPAIALRRPAPGAPGAGQGAVATQRADSATFLGVPEAEMTPAVRGALQTLLTEVGDLRTEVGRLRNRLTEVEGLADRDTLTPLLNRRAFVRELGRAQTFAERYGSPASLVYFDLDDLKGINDRFGHAAGDAALKAVAEGLTAHVRESDVVGRMGGDEFAVILVQTNQATAEIKAAALTRAIEAEPFSFPGGSAAIRLSFGVRQLAPDADLEAVIADADTAMFAAKRQRRAG